MKVSQIHKGYLRIWMLASVLWLLAAILVQWQQLDWVPADHFGRAAWCKRQPGAYLGLYDPVECDSWAAAQDIRASKALLWVIGVPILGLLGLVAVPRIHGWIKGGFDKPYNH